MTNSKDAASSSKSKFLKIVVSFFVILILLGFIGIAVLPSILSTSWGNSKIAKIINSRIAGKITFDDLQLQWLGKQSVKNVQIYDPSGKQIASLESATAKIPLWSAFIHEGQGGTYQVSNLNAQVTQEANGKTNVQNALSNKDSFTLNSSQTPLTILLSNVQAYASLDDEKNAQIQISGNTLEANQEGFFNIDISLADINKNKLFSKNHLNTDLIEKIKIEAKASHFPVSLLDQLVSFSYPSYKGLLLAALGEIVDLNIHEAKGLDGIDLKLEIQSPYVQGVLNGVLKEDRLILQKSSPIKIALQPEFVNFLSQLFSLDDKIQLQKTAQGLLNLSETELVFDLQKAKNTMLDLAKSTILANLYLNEIDLQLVKSLSYLPIQNFNLQIEVPKQSEQMIVSLEGKPKVYADNPQIQLKAFLNKFSLLSNPHLSLSLEQMPLKPFEGLIGEKTALLSELIGSQINAQVNFTKPNLQDLSLDEGLIQLTLSNRDLEANGSFKIHNGLLTSQENPIILKWTLTPERFQLIKKQFSQPTAVGLTSPSQLIFTLKSLSMPLSESKIPRWLNTSITSQISIDSLALKDSISGNQVTLQNIQGTFDSNEISKNIDFSLNGGVFNQKGMFPFNLKGQLYHAFNSDGQLRKDQLALNLDSQFQQFPLKLFGQFLNPKNDMISKASAFLGDTVNGEVHIQMDHLQGPILANLNGDEGQVTLDAVVRNGIMTLNRDFTTQVKLTKEFNEAILSDIFPLSNGLIGADNPLAVTIRSKGFALPIQNFNSGAVQIGSASIELGKLRFSRNGHLGSVLSLFDTTRSDIINVTFTPLYLSMQNGAITFQRMDMLILNTYPIATWGTVNLVSDKVNMIIGITGQALRKAFNIPNLGKDFVLQIPYRGTIDNASIDRKKATAKIAALVAANRGPEGLLIGTALHIASGGLTEERAPPPTSNPLPWSLEEDSTTQSEDPVENIEDAASSIIRQLIPFR